ncbi:VanW family protein [Lysinibacillus sp. BW-2-10]|uniref:VanW family protein n=1 Tax=Lysinibacillus sp. BW-2-10 TaxID=2590030 RepID=UPI00117CA9FF|nr:VanW family protein [Lysinibacillus sp. BW-2-10]TSI09675.1 hypothetical protein FJQ64_04670 [Lysinibacillus sp. BW-2-10]
MLKKCTVLLFLTVLFIFHWSSSAFSYEFTPFTEDLLEDQSIQIIDPLTNRVVKTIIPNDYQLVTNMENFKKEIEIWVRDFARGSNTPHGFNKPLLLDRIDENGNIIKGRPMITIDEPQLVENILQQSFTGGKVDLPIIFTESDYKQEDVPFLDEVTLSSFTTIFNGANFGRSKNIELSAIAIHNIIVGVGDVFSFNLVVGPREVATGYQVAPEIVKGKLVKGIGGGICQTSSTLFNAVDFLDVKTIERHHHSRTVGYVPEGRDATVSFGGLDYRFQNTTGIPFLIKTIYRKGSITVMITTSREYANILKNELSYEKKGETLSFFVFIGFLLYNLEYIHVEFFGKG